MPNAVEFVGLLPMAGRAARLPGIGSSKELMPFGVGKNEQGEDHVRVVSGVLVDRMKTAGIKNFHFVIRKGKWDIPNYYGGGATAQVDICYHVADNESAVPYSINQAFPFVQNKNVAFGFPDIFFVPEDAFVVLKSNLTADNDISMVLGLFPVNDPWKWDVAEISETAWVKNIKSKSNTAENRGLAWIIAVWKPAFTYFLNGWLSHRKHEFSHPANEIQLSKIIVDFIAAGHKVKGVLFEQGVCIDTGTIEGMKEALKKYAAL